MKQQIIDFHNFIDGKEVIVRSGGLHLTKSLGSNGWCTARKETDSLSFSLHTSISMGGGDDERGSDYDKIRILYVKALNKIGGMSHDEVSKKLSEFKVVYSNKTICLGEIYIQEDKLVSITYKRNVIVIVQDKGTITIQYK